MIKFDPKKKKTLKFGFQVENIQSNNLEYYIRLSDNKLDYGIKGEVQQNQIIFEIPPLNEIAEKNIDNLSTIKMEVNSKDNKYYLKPYEDSIEIEKEPGITIKEVNEESEEKEGKKTFFVTEVEDEDTSAFGDNQDNKHMKDKEDTIEENNTEESLQNDDNKLESKEDDTKKDEKKEKKVKNKNLLEFLDK